ncbi:hypothetical protein D9619_011785 [Psilocybe cf. subviscida]|uniref:choline-phosphate cytidylyltransferase n=1 Tax=Psilocybe cf. subviscida TaxID=2480587 RepID=A0A8H5B0W5_9AGAR|nr:hypothetical protein D9619_011785 [Psilocybe cf. subviscida]
MQTTGVDPSRPRTLHSKRSFGKYPGRGLDSPAYDASEEDNDPLTDDANSAASAPIAIARHAANPPGAAAARAHSKASLASRTATATRAHQLSIEDSDGVDSPTYDGDVESSTTAGPDTPTTSHSHNTHKGPHHHHQSKLSTSSISSVSTLNSPDPATPAYFSNLSLTNPLSTASTSGATSSATSTPTARDEPEQPPACVHLPCEPPINTAAAPLLVTEEPAVPRATREAFNPAALTPDDIQKFVAKAIEGEATRKYKINAPPVDRPVRVYADGVYDLFHFGHALQLRQAKSSFPSVYLLVGVNSDEQVWSHKARTVMSHAERLEAVRHCRWVDEVVAEAPWVIDEAFMKKYQIDYVAHDEEAYASGGHDDVYGYVKSQGKFIPTRRTPGVSTSELLERIVAGYRNCDFDEKLTKMGHPELRAEGSDYDDQSRRASRQASPRSTSPTEMHGKGNGHAFLVPDTSHLNVIA